MINVSLKCHYALLSLSYLAQLQNAKPVQLSDIASAHDIPVKYLEQVLSVLRQVGFIQSLRGAKGGYQLLKDPAEISIRDVFNSVLGDTKLESKIKGSVLEPFWLQLMTDSTQLLDYSLDEFMIKWYSSNRLTYTI